jgi:predicted NBD/HSP70 family sugar kinase
MQALGRLGPTSRSRLADEIGLDRSTLTHITGGLLEAGLIEVSRHAPASTRGGRRAELLKLDQSRYVVAGCDVRAGGARWVAVTLDGTVVSNGVIGPSIPSGSLAARSNWLSGIFEDLREALIRGFSPETGGKAQRQIIGFGIAVPGLFAKSQTVLLESHELGLRNIDLQEAWGEQDQPSLFANDASCYAWREVVRESRDSDGVYAYTKFHRDGERFLPSGLGVGVTVISDRRVRRGAHGSAGELRGYKWNEAAENQLGVAIEAIREHDGRRAALKAAATELVRNLAVVASVIDPGRMVIAGDLCTEKGILEEALEESGRGLPIELSAPEPLEIAEGAARMVTEQLFSESSADPRLSFPFLIQVANQ